MKESKRKTILTLLVMGIAIMGTSCILQKQSMSHDIADSYDVTDYENIAHWTQEFHGPEGDVRFNRGRLMPWHDHKSFYIRRTVLSSMLADNWTYEVE